MCKQKYDQERTTHSDGRLLRVAEVVDSLLQTDSGFGQNNTLVERREQVVRQGDANLSMLKNNTASLK